MRIAAALFLLTINLGGAFGEAAAVATDQGDGVIAVELEVEAPRAVTVVAHVIDPGDGQTTHSLGERTGKVFGGSLELEQANLIVVFEAFDNQGSSELSDPVTLLELGIDPAALGTVPPAVLIDPDDEGGLTPELERRIWTAVGLVAASLALLALWVAGPKSEQEQPSDATSEEE